MFIEIIKAVLMGIVEGITEWLPVSSTGHMILLEQLVHFNASEEFLSMFRVVIQLGAILAVVVLFWKKLWPFGIRRGRVSPKPAVFGLWVKVIVATLPALLVSPLDDWMEARFYNHITVAAMLILYGILFIWVENRPAAPRSGRPHADRPAGGVDHRHLAGAGHHPRHLPLRRYHRGRPAAGPAPGRWWQSSPSFWPFRSWRGPRCSRWSSLRCPA